ncbi:MAG: C-GCAxxG-C-C family protein [Proteobacteria bacterium]|nr:C-GCAxxG-C-C family protein [Pseudomonadota bacterium]
MHKVSHENAAPTDPENYSESLLDSGYRCAEAVLLTVARQHKIESPLIPAIATGFCSGMSQTSGMCGAVSGGILGLNLVYGRSRADESAGKNFAAVQRLVAEFKTAFGATGCSELLGCDLGTPEGKQTFRENKLHVQCREYTRVATRLAVSLGDEADE